MFRAATIPPTRLSMNRTLEAMLKSRDFNQAATSSEVIIESLINKISSWDLQSTETEEMALTKKASTL
jgi:hypothetical protein